MKEKARHGSNRLLLVGLRYMNSKRLATIERPNA